MQFQSVNLETNQSCQLSTWHLRKWAAGSYVEECEYAEEHSVCHWPCHLGANLASTLQANNSFAHSNAHRNWRHSMVVRLWSTRGQCRLFTRACTWHWNVVGWSRSGMVQHGVRTPRCGCPRSVFWLILLVIGAYGSLDVPRPGPLVTSSYFLFPSVSVCSWGELLNVGMSFITAIVRGIVSTLKSMYKQVQMGLSVFLSFTNSFWSFLCFVLKKQARVVSSFSFFMWCFQLYRVRPDKSTPNCQVRHFTPFTSIRYSS